MVFPGAAASPAGWGLVALRALRRSRRPGFSSDAGSDAGAGSGTVRGAAVSRS
ncbi:hypothetical protein ACSNOI_09990 [Actinomadura kijaniata]|uniref:hypothetical protein n=1 Tax=Actinomadura kijaniata TaxID=46161 RepID=UPI003F1C4AB5